MPRLRRPPERARRLCELILAFALVCSRGHDTEASPSRQVLGLEAPATDSAASAALGEPTGRESLALALGLACANVRRAAPRLLRRTPRALHRLASDLRARERWLARPVEARLGELIVQATYGVSTGIPGVANLTLTAGPVLAGAESGYETMLSMVGISTTPIGEGLLLLRRKPDADASELSFVDWVRHELELRRSVGFSLPLGPVGWFAMTKHQIHGSPWTGLIVPHVGALFVGRGAKRGLVGMFLVLNPASTSSPTVTLIVSHPAILRRYAPVIDALVAGNQRAQETFQAEIRRTAPRDPHTVPELMALWEGTTATRVDWKELVSPFSVLVREVARTASDVARVKLAPVATPPRSVLADPAVLVRSLALWRPRPTQRVSLRELTAQLVAGVTVEGRRRLRATRSSLARLATLARSAWEHRRGEAAGAPGQPRRGAKERAVARERAWAARRAERRTQAVPRLVRLLAARQDRHAAWRARDGARRYWE